MPTQSVGAIASISLIVGGVGSMNIMLAMADGDPGVVAGAGVRGVGGGGLDLGDLPGAAGGDDGPD